DLRHRREVAEILGIPAERIPGENSLAYDQIMEGIDEGRIKGLWVIATNSAHSWIDQNRCNGLLDKLDCLVVQDMYSTTETAQAAHIYLPAAGWGEKEGTFINSERRIGRIRKVRRAPGQALADFHIFQLLAEEWQCGDLFRAWETPEAVFHLLKALSAGKPCDITGIRDYAHLDDCGGLQWPFSEAEARRHSTSQSPVSAYRERRLFEDGSFHHPDRRARFCFSPPSPLAEPTDDAFPFTLLTGRGTSAQWHTQTRTAKSDVLRKLYPQKLYAEINIDDATRLGISADSPVHISSRRGELTAGAHLCRTVRPGQLFLPMHYPEVNRLTHGSFDPHSRQPSYKACAVRIAPLSTAKNSAT
ncbi:MAG: molybdopterin dinucleotide binding domain-containing protein, partial [Actinomycetota bacterium]